MSNVIISRSVSSSSSSSGDAGWLIGEIRTFSSLRSDLGDDYLLCDGSVVSGYDGLEPYLNNTGFISVTSSGTPPISASYSPVFANGVMMIYNPSYQCPYITTDLINWKPTSGLGGYSPYQLVYGNRIYVVACNEGYTFYSSDAITWTRTSGSSGGSSFPPKYLVYCNDRFIVSCTNGYTYYSTNGISWSICSGLTIASTVAGSSYYFYKIIYSTRLGKYIGGHRLGVYQSTNGIAWTELTTSYTYVASMTEVGTTLIARSRTESGDLIWSTDGGSTWSNNGLYSNTDYNNSSIAYNGSRCVYAYASCTNSETNYAYGIKTSTNGINWTTVLTFTHPTVSSTTISGHAYYENGMFYAGTTGYCMYYSYDGINWNYPTNQPINVSAVGTTADKLVTHYDTELKSFDPTECPLPIINDSTNSQYGYIRVQ